MQSEYSTVLAAFKMVIVKTCWETSNYQGHEDKNRKEWRIRVWERYVQTIRSRAIKVTKIKTEQNQGSMKNIPGK